MDQPGLSFSTPGAQTASHRPRPIVPVAEMTFQDKAMATSTLTIPVVIESQQLNEPLLKIGLWNSKMFFTTTRSGSTLLMATVSISTRQISWSISPIVVVSDVAEEDEDFWDDFEEDDDDLEDGLGFSESVFSEPEAVWVSVFSASVFSDPPVFSGSAPSRRLSPPEPLPSPDASDA